MREAFSNVCILAAVGCANAVLPCLGDGLDSWDWRHPLPQGNSITGIAYGGGLFAATAGRSVLTSPDAEEWATHPLTVSGNLTGIAFGNGIFVAVRAALLT